MFNVGRDVSWASVDPTMYPKKIRIDPASNNVGKYIGTTLVQHCLVNANLYPTPLYTTTNGPSQVMLTG